MVPAIPLMVVVFVAFVVEASIGFGSTVVTVALGALFVPVETILPAFVPLNLLMSIYLSRRYRRFIVWPLVLRRIIPMMLLGMPLGMLAFRRLGSGSLVFAFGAFVVALSVLELVRAHGAGAAARPPLPRTLGGVLLVVAGVIHGAFATGGPLVVYVMGREVREKAAFRATLSLLWLVLNTVLLIGFLWSGKLDAATGLTTAWLLIPLGVGLVVGERLHHRIPEARFRTAMFSLLTVAGVVLMFRSR